MYNRKLTLTGEWMYQFSFLFSFVILFNHYRSVIFFSKHDSIFLCVCRRCQERAHACSLTHDDLESFSVVVPPDELVIMSSCETVRRVHSISTEGGKAISMENNIGATSPGKALSVKSSTNGNSKRVIPQATTQWKSSNKSIGASKKSGIFESKTSSIFHLFTKKDSNVYYRPNVLRYDPSVPRSKKPLESLMQKKRLFPAAAALEDCNSCRADFAYLALSSVSSLELLNLINSGSQWLVMFLAGIEGVPLCVSMHSAEYYRGSNVVFPYIYANKYHESVFNVDRNHLVGESLDILFDRADAEQIVAGEDEQQAAKLRTTSAASMPDIYMGLVRGMPSIFCRMVNPLLESGGNMLSVLGSDPQNETFDNATLSAPPVGADTMHVMGGDDSSLRSSSKYSGLVIGVKPIFAGDKNTIIGVITIQQKINAKEKWLQGYKYIEDMLALIPEECDIREYEGSYNFSSYVTGGMKDSSSSPVSKKGSDAYKL